MTNGTGDNHQADPVKLDRVLILDTTLRDGEQSPGAAMKKILADIQSGRFARDWVLENKAGQPSFKAMRALSAAQPIEQVGEKLRGMMPWIAKNRLVDKSRN